MNNPDGSVRLWLCLMFNVYLTESVNYSPNQNLYENGSRLLRFSWLKKEKEKSPGKCWLSSCSLQVELTLEYNRLHALLGPSGKDKEQ